MDSLKKNIRRVENNDKYAATIDERKSKRKQKEAERVNKKKKGKGNEGKREKGQSQVRS